MEEKKEECKHEFKPIGQSLLPATGKIMLVVSFYCTKCMMLNTLMNPIVESNGIAIPIIKN